MTRKQQRDFQEGDERQQVTMEQQTFKEQSVLTGLAKSSSNDFF